MDGGGDVDEVAGVETGRDGGGDRGRSGGRLFPEKLLYIIVC